MKGIALVFLLPFFWKVSGITNVTILEPDDHILQDLCPGDSVVIKCNVSGSQLTWRWQQNGRDESFQLAFVPSLNRILPFISTMNSMLPAYLQITLIDSHTMGSVYLTSSLQYYISENFEDDWVTCNNVRVTLSKDCSLILTKISILNFTNFLNTSLFHFAWRSNFSRKLRYSIGESSLTDNISTISIPIGQSFIELSLNHRVNYTVTIRLDSYGNDMIVAIVDMVAETCGNFCTLIQTWILNNNTATMKTFQLSNDGTIVFPEIPTAISADSTNNYSSKSSSEVNGVFFSHSVIAITFIILFILVAILTLCGAVLGWKASSHYSKRQKYKSNENNIEAIEVQSQENKTDLQNAKEIVMYEEISSYTKTNQDDNEVKVNKNLAYSHVSLVTSFQ